MALSFANKYVVVTISTNTLVQLLYYNIGFIDQQRNTIATKNKAHTFTNLFKTF